MKAMRPLEPTGRIFGTNAYRPAGFTTGAMFCNALRFAMWDKIPPAPRGLWDAFNQDIEYPNSSSF